MKTNLIALLLAALAGTVSAEDATLYQIKNRWLKQCLADVSGAVVYQAPAGGPPPLVKRGTVSVIAPVAGAAVRGEVRIDILAPGLGDAVVKCWQQGAGFGADVTLGVVQLDADGKGVFVFPADQFPHGPLTVRVTGLGRAEINTYNLQLYNEGGVSWNEGAPKEPPPPAAGMKLVYLDDFDAPLSISKTGADAKYAAHKPGGGDFGKIPFSDFESEKNPFAQRDTYLRIRVDANKNSAGLLSSLRLDGTGFTASAPCYFECRFIAQSAPTTWPAFWVMTRDTFKGLKEPADELDIIEAYGGFGQGFPNQTGYWITSHRWNQDDGQKLPGVYQQVPMTTLGGGSGWWETFHIYGCKITATDTIYYFDNIEVGRHPTYPLSKTRPFFFFINHAFPGHGWPADPSSHGGVYDLYVDYVRVWQE
ncbi:MAG: glycoside hydrolase family 16 protein [Verrucomicrobiales bacterium]|jgi:hypothetical protein|nr:glycoside hydrolase family 16 protein [Verrucomicrobiales bacterium]